MAEFVPAPPQVMSHDPAWAKTYSDEANRLHAALAQAAHWIEHVGSTAVPGLPAKPVIDVMVGVTDYDRFAEIRRVLEEQGYAWDPAAERDEPARKVFRKGSSDRTQQRTHHLHLTIKGGDYWRRLLAFRDQLRRDPDAAAEYAAVKYALIRTCGGDSRAYTRGKHDVVKKIERAAGVQVHDPER